MTSLVTEVLASAGQLEKEDLDTKLSHLDTQINELKLNVYESLDKQYGQFDPSHTNDLSGRYRDLSEQLDSTKSKIENEINCEINNSSEEFIKLSSQLAKSTSILIVVDRLVEIHKLLNSIEKARISKNFVEAAKYLISLKELLVFESKDENLSERMEIFQHLRKAYNDLMASVKGDLEQLWQRYIVLEEQNELKEKKSYKKNKVPLCALTIVSKSENISEIQDILQAMCNLNMLDEYLKKLSNISLYKHILLPLVDGHNFSSDISKNCAVLNIDVEKNENSPMEVAISKVHNISVVLDFLYKTIFGIKINKPNTSEKESDNDMEVELMHLVGSIIGEQTIEAIIEKCLVPAIPSNCTEIKAVDKIESAVNHLHKTMVDVKFIPSSNTALTDYVENFDVHFSNKMCQDILYQAQTLMKKNLHSIIQVKPNIKAADDKNIVESEKTKTQADVHIVSLSSNTFQFPACQISENIQKVMTLVLNTLKEATENASSCAVQLFYCTRNIFELFCSVVPIFHKETLSTVPLMAAIHHNNCMYLAHNLLTLGHQFKLKFPEPLTPDFLTYVDLVPKIRRIGTECFLQMMLAQKSQILESLKLTEGFINVSDDTTILKAQKGIKQCLSQLQHLSNVWRDVLPVHVYNKSIGTLIKSMIEEIVQSISLLEDITLKDATSIAAIFTLVIDKIPNYFVSDDPEKTISNVEIEHHSSKWLKFLEMKWLMLSSLDGINDRWAEGMGPLTMHFTANEMKRMIRALFENNKLRAAVLSTIK